MIKKCLFCHTQNVPQTFESALIFIFHRSNFARKMNNFLCNIPILLFILLHNRNTLLELSIVHVIKSFLFFFVDELVNVRKGGVVLVLYVFVLYAAVIFDDVVVDLLEDAVIIVDEIAHLFFYFLMNEAIQKLGYFLNELVEFDVR